jgi:hypothetical protein
MQLLHDLAKIHATVLSSWIFTGWQGWRLDLDILPDRAVAAELSRSGTLLSPDARAPHLCLAAGAQRYGGWSAKQVRTPRDHFRISGLLIVHPDHSCARRSQTCSAH